MSEQVKKMWSEDCKYEFTFSLTMGPSGNIIGLLKFGGPTTYEDWFDSVDWADFSIINMNTDNTFVRSDLLIDNLEKPTTIIYTLFDINMESTLKDLREAIFWNVFPMGDPGNMYSPEHNIIVKTHKSSLNMDSKIKDVPIEFDIITKDDYDNSVYHKDDEYDEFRDAEMTEFINFIKNT